MTDETNNNVRPFRIAVSNETAPVAEDESLPTSNYVIRQIDGQEPRAEGFLLFTSHHIAIMRDTGKGAMPVLVVPLNMVAHAALVEDESAPF